MSNYLVTLAPGCYGAKTTVISVHETWREAIAAALRGRGRCAVYRNNGFSSGDTVYADHFASRRLDRLTTPMPQCWVEPSNDGKQYWLCGMSAARAHLPNLFSHQNGDGSLISGPYPTKAEAERALRALERAWMLTPVSQPLTGLGW